MSLKIIKESEKRIEWRSRLHLMGIFLKFTYVENENFCKGEQKVNKDFVRKHLRPIKDSCLFQTVTLYYCLLPYLTLYDIF